jgi:splicing factor 3A subunit 3
MDLEVARQLHQDLERMRRSMVSVIVESAGGARLQQQHSLRELIRAYQSTVRRLLAYYADADGVRREQLEAMGGANLLTAFYERLKDIREHHRRYPTQAAAAAFGAVQPTGVAGAAFDATSAAGAAAAAAAAASAASAALAAALGGPEAGSGGASLFSVDERRGKYVDMAELYERFIALPHAAKLAPHGKKHLSYLVFLRDLPLLLGRIARHLKVTPPHAAPYVEWLDALVAYLRGFVERVFPLHNLSRYEAVIDEEFAERWAARHVFGWFAGAPEPRPFEDAQVSAARAGAGGEKAAEKAPEKAAKEAKAAEDGGGAKSGGKFCEVCKTTLASEAVYAYHVQGRKHKARAAAAAAAAAAAPAAAAASGGNAAEGGDGERDKEKEKSPPDAWRAVARREALALGFAELLRDRIAATQGYQEKKATWTVEEKLKELREEEEAEAAERAKGAAGTDGTGAGDEEDEDKFINYKNVPLGWDGKPIPYWLYKLHGLNLEFPCEICGNYVYFGPRNFERHFSEPRHAYSMKCLGIPNTRHFHGVTKIQDAIALHEKLKAGNKNTDFRPEEDEEFEDREGNVYNRKTYEDLRREGLL